MLRTKKCIVCGLVFAYLMSNKLCCSQKCRDHLYYITHTDHIRERSRVYHLNNRERTLTKRREYSANYHQNNRDRLNLKSHNRYWFGGGRENDKIKRQNLSEEAKQLKLEKCRIYSRTERGSFLRAERQRAAGYNYSNSRKQRVKTNTPKELALTKKEWEMILDLYNHKCVYCGYAGKLTKDHRIPISRGGLHTFMNIVPACKNCNSSKHTKTSDEFWKSLV